MDGNGCGGGGDGSCGVIVSDRRPLLLCFRRLY